MKHSVEPSGQFRASLLYCVPLFASFVRAHKVVLTIKAEILLPVVSQKTQDFVTQSDERRSI